MSAPKVVIFDMDEVLCRYDLGRRLRALSEITGKDPRDIRAALWDSGFEEEADAGQFEDADEYLWQLSRRLGHPITRSEWVAARRESMIPDETVLRLAKAMGADTRLVIFTEGCPLVKMELDRLFPEAASLFSERYSAKDFGGKHPDPKAFAKLLDTLGIPAKDAWFIDDKKAHVKEAQLAGVNAHHFKTAEGLAKEAKALGFKIN